VAFLIAHVIYIVANVGVAVWPGWIAGVAAVVLAGPLCCCATRAAGTVIRIATIVYGGGDQRDGDHRVGTVGARCAGRRWRRSAGCCSTSRTPASRSTGFTGPFPHVAYLALGVYWLGQLGIALAARGPVG